MNSAPSIPKGLDAQHLKSLNVSAQAEQGPINTLDFTLPMEDYLHPEAPPVDSLHSEDHVLSEDHLHLPHPEDHPHPHIHDEASVRRLINRLSRIEGHIRGIKTMIQEHRPCPEVLTQVAAVRGALDKVARTILDEHLTECVAQAAKQGDPAKVDQEIAQLRSALKQFF